MSESFNSENLDVIVDKKKDCIVSFDVDVKKELVEKAKKEALKEVKKDVSIKGFRKGKAPDDLIQKQYSANIEATWKKKIADISFIEMQKLTKIYPLNSSVHISFDLKSYSLDGAKLTFSFETRPILPEKIDRSEFKLKEIKEEKITQKEIDEAIRQSQFFFAKFTEVDREIKEGDFVILDLESLDTKPPTKVFSGTRFEIKDKSIAKWMKDLLIGKKPKDVVEGLSKPDEDLPPEEKEKFEEKKVRVTIVKIEEANLPDLDEEFAKKLGAKDVASLKENVEKMLQNQKNIKIEKEKRAEVNKFLIDNFDFEKPKSMLDGEVKYRKDQLLNDPKFKHKYDQMTKEQKMEMEKEIERQSNDAIALFYLSRKIIEDNDIKITKEDLENEVKNILMEQNPYSPEKIDVNKAPESTYALAASKLIMMKAQDFILENSNIDKEKKIVVD